MRVSRAALASPVVVLVSSVLFTAFVALAATFTVELWQVGGRFDLLWQGSIGEHLGLFLLGALVVWLVVVLLVAVVGRLWFTAGIIAALTVAIGFANYHKQQLRLEPLYPSDLSLVWEVGFLSQMVGPQTTILLGVAVVTLLAGGVLLGHFADKVFPRIRRATHPRLGTWLVVTRVGAAALSALALFYVTDFNSRGNAFRAAYDDQGARWKSWHQSANYLSNGFVGGMLYNTDVPGMAKPSDYSRATMGALTEKYAAVADRINRDRDPDALEDVNVVMVLSETFSDPTRLEGVDVAEDPMPYTRSLMRRTTSGNMLATQFGGGTANMEFGALTSMSLALFQPQMTMPYQMMVPEYDRFPSIVGYLEQTGHRAVAIHPFLPALYRREQVYPVLGFDQAMFQGDLKHQERIERNPYIADSAAFRETSDILRDTDEPAFVNLVTMQNHFPMTGSYSDPIPVEGMSNPTRAESAAHYARGLRHSDEALRDFITSLEESREKTVVLFYGDHLPAFWPREVRRTNGARAMRETPFFVYANFGQPPVRRLPTTSPVYFAQHVLEAADATLPPYYALLTELEAEITAIAPGMLIGPDDSRINPRNLSARARELLHDYRLVQYDLSVGRRFAQDDLFYPDPSLIETAGGVPAR